MTDPYLPDGGVIQAGLLVPNMAEAEMVVVPLSGVVWAVHYPDDSDDIVMSPNIEYTVILGTRQTVRCRSGISSGGHENGLVRVLNHTTKTTDGSPLDKDFTPLAVMNGDHVELTALYGQPSQLMITSILPHPASTLTPKKEDGPVVFMNHQGTKASLTKDGELIVERNNFTFKMDKDGLVTVDNGGTAQFLATDALKAVVGDMITLLSNPGVIAVLSNPASGGYGNYGTDIGNIATKFGTTAVLTTQLKAE